MGKRPPQSRSSKRPPATVADLVGLALSRFRAAKLVFAHGTSDPVAEAAFLVCEALHVPPQRFDASARRRVSAAERAAVLDLIEARIRTRKPAAYLVHKSYIQGVPFYVDERVIVPRSYLGEILASDLIAEEGYALVDPRRVARVLDLCTGSGCLAVLAALRFPHAAVDAVDLSDDALEVARINVAEHRLADRVRLLCGDLFAPLADARYDLILTNPPFGGKEGVEAQKNYAYATGSTQVLFVQDILGELGKKTSVRRNLENLHPGNFGHPSCTHQSQDRRPLHGPRHFGPGIHRSFLS